MYKALDRQNGIEILILAPLWRGRVAYLRALDRQDRLVCQGCEQPVRVRAGQWKRWHFAHKHLHNCPFQSASPALLAARAVLYDWLLERFGAAAVDSEKLVAAADLPRPLDAWVDTGPARFAYWLIETRLHPPARAALQPVAGRLGVPLNWVCLVDLLRLDANQPNAVHLTTTERAFMQASEYDRTAPDTLFASGKSLHYLDAARAEVVTFRALRLQHPPQLFSGARRCSPLAQLGAAPHNGEFVHPGEIEQLAQARREQQVVEQRLQKAAALLGRFASGRLTAPLDPSPSANAPHLPAAPDVSPAPAARLLAVCQFCGALTDDWWYLDRATQRCKCRACYSQGLA